MNDIVLSAVNVSRIFPMPAGPVVAVRDVTLDDRTGRTRGDSRTVGLRQVDAAAHAGLRGYAVVRNADVRRPRHPALDDRARSLLRLRHIGFVFQRFFLLPMLTAAENVELPQSEAESRGRAAAAQRAARYAGSARAQIIGRRSCQGGEMQRVAIAARSPTARGCCWPTSPRELDQATGEQVAALLDRVNADGTALVIVTHDAALAAPRAAC